MAIFGRRRQFPVGNPNRSSKSALTASGFRISHQDSDMMRRLIQPWQSRSFSYYHQLGEIKYAAQYYSRALSNLVLYAAEIDAAGDLVATKNADAIDALDRIQDPGGGRSGLLSSYGRLMFLAGECYLFVTLDPDTGMEQWEMLSTDELRVQSGTYIRYKAPSMYAEDYREPKDDDWEPVDDDHAVAYRLWQRDPQYSMLADSTMQGVLDICEELLILTRAVRSRARSRLAGAGVLFLDERISPSAPLEPAPDEDPDEDVFLADLTEAMTAPIVDEGTASAVVPLVVRVPVPDSVKVSDLVYHLQIIDPMQLYPETGLRNECIRRIAIGLDMPPEILLGTEDVNHWGAWLIDEQSWKSHLQPKAQQLCDDLTSSYFRPMLRQQGVADYAKYAIVYDATAIINHPDRTKDAKDLYAARAIGKKALREASGFDEEDAPTEDERAEMIGVAVRDSSLAWDGIPTIKAGGLEPEPGEVIAQGVETGTPEPDKTGSSVEPGPPPSKDAPTQESVVGAAAADALTARLLGAADLALLRAREAAGNRLRSLAKRDPEAHELLDGVPVGMVAATLGPERVRALGASELDLVAGARDLIADALRMWDIDADVAAKVADLIEQHAARTLYEARPSPLPSSFTNYVAGLTAKRG